VNNDKVRIEDNEDKSNKARDIAIGNKEICIGVASLHMISLHNCKGVENSAGAGGMFGSQPFYAICGNYACMITNAIVVCHMHFVHTLEGETQMILTIIVLQLQEADLRRIHKHKRGKFYGWVSIPL
jgi:hypothetical protein